MTDRRRAEWRPRELLIVAAAVTGLAAGVAALLSRDLAVTLTVSLSVAVVTLVTLAMIDLAVSPKRRPGDDKHFDDVDSPQPSGPEGKPGQRGH